jgi:uncharacterized membrane protein YbhN (UPF0104 family)
MPLPAATASFVYVRAAEVPPLVLIVVAAAPALSIAVARSSRRLELAAAAVAIAMVGIWLGRTRVRGGLARVRDWHTRVRIAPRVWAAAIGYAALAQVETLLRQIAIAAAFGFPLSLQQSATVTALGVVGGLVPHARAPDVAIAITVAERAISYGLSTSLGAAALAGLGGRAVLRWAADTQADAAVAG